MREIGRPCTVDELSELTGKSKKACSKAVCILAREGVVGKKLIVKIMGRRRVAYYLKDDDL
jgi:DNA-binding transcriptional regulator GbsR (MarR family)